MSTDMTTTEGNTAKGSILVVDDERSMREMLSIMLKKEGHDVVVADCGKAAVEILRRRPVDLLISDIKMPDMSGVEVLRAYVLTGFPWASPPQALVDGMAGQGLAWVGPHGMMLWLMATAWALPQPSASLAASYRMSIVLLEDGRILNGVIGERTGRTITLQTPTEKIVLDRAAISEMRSSELSLMPEGLLTDLSEEHVRDLLGYLMR